MTVEVEPGSFRDPAGFVYRRGERLLRQVNRGFAPEFDAVAASGLFEELIGAGLLVGHAVVSAELAASADAHLVLEPEQIPLISYPYEWSFGQLKDAALLTLDLQARALRRGMTLRDASAFNVQFRGATPVFIDTLSFEPHEDGRPWAAYRQFCEHFLAPLALMARCDIRYGALLKHYLDGIPLDFASAALPRSSWLSPALLLHLHLHARAQRKYAHTSVASATAGRGIRRSQVLLMVEGLRSTIAGMDWRPAGTEWAEYTTEHNYTAQGLASKQRLVREFLARSRARTVWDLGANTGVWSRVAREAGASVASFDVDPAAVERNYRDLRAGRIDGILPLLLDLRNPSPGCGWAHRERSSLAARGPADLVMALALVHHLAISNNVPLDDVASFLAGLGRYAIVEFVAKTDGQVQRLLRNRPDIFPRYTRDGFEAAFSRHYRILQSAPVAESERHLYLLERLEDPRLSGTG